MTPPIGSHVHRPRLVPAVLVVLALLLAAACGRDAPKKHAMIAPDVASYAALGDSYTAVSGAGPFTDDSCFRSADNYPNLLRKKLTVGHFSDVSCGGATSTNLTHSQYPSTGGVNPPQLGAVTTGTTLVTLGIGLNDNGLSSSLLQACLEFSQKPRATCRTYLAQPDAAFAALVRTMGTAVTGNLKAIRAAAPQARIVLVGYPRLVAEGSACPAQLSLSDAALSRLRWLGREVNTTLKRVAAGAGADFIDMYDASAGHEVCSKDPWVNGQGTVTGLALPFHPYEAYHAAVADRLAALLQRR
jgi:hypothetical protein